MIYFFTALIILDTAHNMSPMAMAWSRADFRKVMLRRRLLYLLLPVLALTTSMLVATQSRSIVDGLMTVYIIWNVWHFASQNYGLVRLWQIRQGWSWQPDWPFCMAVTIVGMVVWPVLASDPWHWRLVNLAIFAVPHWTSEVFLTSWASTRWKMFAPLILAAGCVGFLWATPRANGMPVIGVFWVCLRAGLGFVHFIYDGMIWRFSDPEVRATIGSVFIKVPT